MSITRLHTQKDDHPSEEYQNPPSETGPEPMEHDLKEEQLQLVFDLRRDMVELSFIMEKMDSKLNFLLTLQAHPISSPSHESNFSTMAIPE